MFLNGGGVNFDPRKLPFRTADLEHFLITNLRFNYFIVTPGMTAITVVFLVVSTVLRIVNLCVKNVLGCYFGAVICR